MHTIFSLVAAEMGVSLVPDGARSMRVDGVAVVPLAEFPLDLTWDLSVVWKPKGAGRPLRALIDIVRSLR
jgi:DNA-binding transcriptional LysR family regulator